MKITIALCIIAALGAGLWAGVLPYGLTSEMTFDDLLSQGYELEIQDDESILIKPPAGRELSETEKNSMLRAYFLFEGKPWMTLAFIPNFELSKTLPDGVSEYLKAEFGAPLPEKSVQTFVAKYSAPPTEVEMVSMLLSGTFTDYLMKLIVSQIISGVAEADTTVKPELWLTKELYVFKFTKEGQSAVFYFNYKKLQEIANQYVSSLLRQKI